MNLSTLCRVKETRPRRVHSVWSHLHEVLEQTELTQVIEIRAVIASGSRLIGQLHEGTFWGDEIIL